MSFTITLKNYEPSADQKKLSKGRLPTKHGMTVRGAFGAFTPQVKNLLAMHGFIRNEKSQDVIMWSLKPTSAPPPLYMVEVLKSYGKVVVGRDIQVRIDTALGYQKRQADLFEFDESTGPPGGKGAIKIGFESGLFVASCNADDQARKTYLEGAGWRPRPLRSENPGNRPLIAKYGNAPWVTKEATMAANLAFLMPSDVLEKFRAQRQHENEILKRSRDTGLPAEGRCIPLSPQAIADGKKPFDFQEGGVLNASRSGTKKRRGAIIGDDMGLGKSIQLAGLIGLEANAQKIVVFCKANMKLKLKEEIEYWSWRGHNNPIPPVTVLSGRSDTFDVENPGIIILNYDIAENYRPLLEQVKWDIIAADETQNICNPDAGRTRAVLGNVRDGYPMLPLAEGGIIALMSGTLPNKIERLFTLLSATRPDVFGDTEDDRRRFINRYCPPQMIAVRKPKKGTPKDAELNEGNSYVMLIPLEGEPMRMAELFFRMRRCGVLTARLKSDMKGILPDKSRYPIQLPIKLSKEVKEQLRQGEADMERIALQVAAESEREGIIAARGTPEYASRVINVISGITRDMPEFQEVSNLRKNLGILKAPYAADYIIQECEEEDAGGGLEKNERRKKFISAHHKEVVKIIRDRLEARYPGSTIVYDGSVTTDKKRKRLVDEFQDRSEDSARFLIGSQSASTGITLTAAADMYSVEMFWDPNDMEQTEDRIYRIGQELPVEIGYMFVPDSYDLRVGMVMIRKAETAQRIYHKPDLSGTALSKVVSRTRTTADLLGNSTEHRHG